MRSAERMTPSHEFIADDLAAVVDLHDAGEHEAVEVRAQAADVGGEFERQHGDGAVGKVDAGAAQAGFLIERGVGRDVLGDVGDVDLQFVIVVGEHADAGRRRRSRGRFLRRW